MKWGIIILASCEYHFIRVHKNLVHNSNKKTINIYVYLKISLCIYCNLIFRGMTVYSLVSKIEKEKKEQFVLQSLEILTKKIVDKNLMHQQSNLKLELYIISFLFKMDSYFKI